MGVAEAEHAPVLGDQPVAPAVGRGGYACHGFGEVPGGREPCRLPDARHRPSLAREPVAVGGCQEAGDGKLTREVPHSEHDAREGEREVARRGQESSAMATAKDDVRESTATTVTDKGTTRREQSRTI